MPYFICEKSHQKFELKYDECFDKLCPFLTNLGNKIKCTYKTKSKIKDRKIKIKKVMVGGMR